MKVRLFKCLQLSALSGLGTLLLYLSWTSGTKYLRGNTEFGSNAELSIVNIPTIEPQLFKLRQSSVRELCKNFNLTAAVKLPRTIIYSKTTNIAYCPVMYTGSTTIKYAILHTEGIRAHRQYKTSYEYGIHIEAQKLALRRNLHKLSAGKVNLLLVVRDPWQRLVTAYRRLTSPSNPSNDMKWCHGTLEFKTMDLTFNQFLDCVIKKKEIQNLYLQPISEVCAVCKIDYDRIVRLENLLPELKTFYTEVSEKHRTNTAKFLAAVSAAPMSQNYDIAPYLKSVSKANQDKIQHVYKYDFLMFGYNYLNEYDADLSHRL